MRRVPSQRTALFVISCVVLGGCSSGMRLGGPSWNLTSGRDAAPPAAQRPTAPIAATPQHTPPTITYRGGRDPITGKAPSWGGTPAGIERRDLAPPAPPATAVHPTPVPSAPVPSAPVPSAPAAHSPAPGAPTPTLHAPPTLPAPSRVTTSASGRRTVEVLPGHSLALIAQQHRVSIAALMSVNKLRDPYVYPGQVLVLP